MLVKFQSIIVSALYFSACPHPFHGETSFSEFLCQYLNADPYLDWKIAMTFLHLVNQKQYMDLNNFQYNFLYNFVSLL